ncbi:hypothetical protein ACTHO5_08875 [Cytobacillus praedii]|uniref:hypothetical protein n=1 Tax=Cytobacillus praedii TaxID=1742358 RepID=UPI003F81F8C1
MKLPSAGVFFHPQLMGLVEPIGQLRAVDPSLMFPRLPFRKGSYCPLICDNLDKIKRGV